MQFRPTEVTHPPTLCERVVSDDPRHQDHGNRVRRNDADERVCANPAAVTIVFPGVAGDVQWTYCLWCYDQLREQDPTMPTILDILSNAIESQVDAASMVLDKLISREPVTDDDLLAAALTPELLKNWEDVAMATENPDLADRMGDLRTRVTASGTKRDVILTTVDDLVTNFVFYDRKEDEELSVDDIKSAFDQGFVTVDDVVQRFREKLTAWNENPD